MCFYSAVSWIQSPAKKITRGLRLVPRWWSYYGSDNGSTGRGRGRCDMVLVRVHSRCNRHLFRNLDRYLSGWITCWIVSDFGVNICTWRRGFTGVPSPEVNGKASSNDEDKCNDSCDACERRNSNPCRMSRTGAQVGIYGGIELSV